MVKQKMEVMIMSHSVSSSATVDIKQVRAIIFKSEAHKSFYQGAYHKALVYCLVIDRDMRENVDRIFMCA